MPGMSPLDGLASPGLPEVQLTDGARFITPDLVMPGSGPVQQLPSLGDGASCSSRCAERAAEEASPIQALGGTE